jgi:hypothetical protein
MRKIATGLVLMGLVAGAAVAAPDPGVSGTRLCLGGNLIMLNMEGGDGGERGMNAFLKIHAGTRFAGTSLALSALFGNYIKGFGVTIGYIF